MQAGQMEYIFVEIVIFQLMGQESLNPTKTCYDRLVPPTAQRTGSPSLPTQGDQLPTEIKFNSESEEWEERFDKEFTGIIGRYFSVDGVETHGAVKSFISKELSLAHRRGIEEAIEMIEKMKWDDDEGQLLESIAVEQHNKELHLALEDLNKLIK